MQSTNYKTRQDWATLPEDMIILISQKVSTTNIMYVHLRTVCKAWRRALTPHPRHLPRQAPWLLLPRLGDFTIRFYDLYQSKTHQFELPYTSGKSIYGSSYGWLILNHDYQVSLLNPITKQSINLPSVDTISNSTTEWSPPFTYCLKKVVLSCNPTDPDCIVVAKIPPSCDWELIFCRTNDTHWRGLKRRETHKNLMDFTCHNNSLYTVNTKKEVSVINLQNLTEWTYPSKIKYNSNLDRINLAEGDAESDGPLVVNTSEYLRKIDKIYVYKWFNDRQQWRRVRDIGNRVLYLNLHNCINLRLKEAQGNEIYYDVRRDSRMYTFRVGINRVNLESATDIPHNPSPLEVFTQTCGGFSWFTPSLF